jgi:hypothetical protein
MTIGIEGDFARGNMTGCLRKSLCASLVLAAVAASLSPTQVRADDSVRIGGTFTVTYMRPSAVDYCAPSGGNLHGGRKSTLDGVTPGTVNGTAFYLVQGSKKMLSPGKH